VLAPAALAAIGSLLMIWRPASGVPQWAIWTSASLQIGLVLGTAFWWGPLMARLESPEGSLSLERHHLLMRSHWIRVGVISAHTALVLWMLTASARCA